MKLGAHLLLTVTAVLTLASGCVTRRIDNQTVEIHGIASFVELRSGNACGKDSYGNHVHGRVETLDYEAARTTTGSVESSRTTTGSCDRSGTCLSTTTTTSTPITWTRAPRKRVRVTCPQPAGG